MPYTKDDVINFGTQIKNSLTQVSDMILEEQAKRKIKSTLNTLESLGKDTKLTPQELNFKAGNLLGNLSMEAGKNKFIPTTFLSTVEKLISGSNKMRQDAETQKLGMNALKSLYPDFNMEEITKGVDMNWIDDKTTAIGKYFGKKDENAPRWQMVVVDDRNGNQKTYLYNKNDRTGKETFKYIKPEYLENGELKAGLDPKDESLYEVTGLPIPFNEHAYDKTKYSVSSSSNSNYNFSEPDDVLIRNTETGEEKYVNPKTYQYKKNEKRADDIRDENKANKTSKPKFNVTPKK